MTFITTISILLKENLDPDTVQDKSGNLDLAPVFSERLDPEVSHETLTM